MTVNNPNEAFGYSLSTGGGETEGGDYLVGATVTKGNLVQLSATTPTVVIPAVIGTGDLGAIVGVALKDAIAGESIPVNKGGFVVGVKDATVVCTAGDNVVKSATTAGQFITAAAAATFPGANFGWCVIGATAVAGTILIHYNHF